MLADAPGIADVRDVVAGEHVHAAVLAQRRDAAVLERALHRGGALPRGEIVRAGRAEVDAEVEHDRDGQHRHGEDDQADKADLPRDPVFLPP